jgi:tellurite resistance protein
MVYLGWGLKPASPFRGIEEPALINPRLSVSWVTPDRQGRFMPYYWPVYSQIAPTSRAAYLQWLAGGRRDPSAFIGYVFLFFYGIERRVFVDARESERVRPEIVGLLAEVERLLELYGKNDSFRTAAVRFLEFARLLHEPIDLESISPARTVGGFDVPMSLKLALGACAKARRPIPPEWALLWTLTSPRIRLRTAAERCAEEFEELFKIRFAQAFPEGFRIKPGRRDLTAYYQPASPTFSGSFSLTLAVPEVSDLPSPVRKLQQVADLVQEELGSFSRWMGRTGEGRSPAAVALLPPELAARRGGETVRRFIAWIEQRLAGGETAMASAADLSEWWPFQVRGKISPRDAEKLAAFLGQRGYGLEPDVRLGSPPPGTGSVVLFRLAPEAGEPGPAHRAAAVLLHLSVALAAADGPVNAAEERHLSTYLESVPHLSPAERTRLRACLRWLIAAPPGLTGLKRRLEPLAEPTLRGIARFLVTVAGADGHVGAEELKLLARIYPLLGLPAQAVFSDVHALASAAGPPAAEPVTVRPAAPGPGGYAIPPAPSPAFSLDSAKVRAKLAESRELAGLLSRIFGAEDEPDRATGPSRVAGLDAPHSALLLRLAERAAWERAEVERLAADCGLLPGGALETLNEAAFERCGAPLLEGDQTLEIDRQVLQEILL